MYVAYVDSTCHYVVLRGYYVADTIKFYEGLTQRLRGLPVALRMLRGSLRGPRFTWRLRYRQFVFPKFVLRCSYEAALRKGVTTALHLLRTFIKIITNTGKSIANNAQDPLETYSEWSFM